MKRSSKERLGIAVLVVLSSGLWACDSEVGETVSKCSSCLDSEICVKGECIDSSRVCGEIVCDEAERCLELSCVKTSDLCGGEVCADGLVCREDHCVADDLCANKECGEGQVCREGECISLDPCANKECGEGLVCRDGECIKIDPCASVTCPDGKTCVEGDCIEDACVEDGKEKTCDEGQMCVGGNCIDDGCVDKSCPDGWECIKGECEESACIGKVCEDGRTCVAGGCVDNECLEMTCDEGLVCSKGMCMYAACVGKDPCAQGKACQEDGACGFVLAPALILGEVQDKETDESGKSLMIEVSLNNQPTEAVSLECEVQTDSPNEEAGVVCENILFDILNWDKPQYFVITGVGDSVIDGDQAYAVVLKTVSEDEDFNGLSVSLEDLKNLDKDTAEVRIEAENLKTGEDGTAAEVAVSLSSKPSADVVIGISSDNLGEGTVAPDSLTFTPENWNVPQTVTVTGVDDDAQDGNQTYHLVFANLVSEDEHFDGLEIPALEVINQDNDVAGFMVSPEGIETDEAGDNGKVAIMSIKLNTLPSADVNFRVVVSEADAKEVSVSATEFVIAKAAWKEAVEIRAVGVADFIIDGNKDYEIKFVSASEDAQYDGLEMAVHGVNIDMDKAGVTTMLSGASEVTEAGSSVDVSVVLNSIPAKEVTVNAVAEDTTELSVLPASLVFTKDNWNQAQKLIVKGVDDHIIDGDIKSVLGLKLASEDTHFDKIEDSIEFVTLDDDKAGWTILSEAASFLEDSKATAMITVVLTAQPDKPVMVSAVSTDITELSVIEGATLTFTAENWDKPQTVTVQVVDDKQADGNQIASVKFSSASEDANFNGFNDQSAEYTILDNETASLVLTAKSNELFPGAYSTTVSAILGSEPLSDVTVALSTTNDKTAKLSKSEVTFTPSNWSEPQTFTVTMTDENALAAVINTEIISGIASGSGVYSGLRSNDLTLTIYRFYDDLEFDYTGKVQSTTLYPGRYKLEVWGAQGGNGSGRQTNLGGKGGYSSGIITLTEKTNVFVYVGGQGGSILDTSAGAGGFNGGGDIVVNAHSNSIYRGAGGGATDIRIGTDSLYARVIVAGGGGGAGGNNNQGSCEFSGEWGQGGGVNGVKGADFVCNTPHTRYGGRGGTQTAGGIYGLYGDSEQGTERSGTFGVGGTGGNYPINIYGGGAGGGGWYGGGGGAGGGGYGGGGSGWVYTEANDKAGYTSASYTGGAWLLNSKHYLTSTQTIAGNVSFNSPSGSTETGHGGNGYARISAVK